VARRFGAEIVSVDSMQVFRGMNIGTAKPSVRSQSEIPHHMIDVAEPSDDFDVTQFQSMARAAIDGAADKAKRILIVGGSGLHYRVIVDPYTFAPTDPIVRAELDGQPSSALTKRLLGIDNDAGSHVDLANKRRVVRAIEVWELTGESPSARAASPERRMISNFEPLIEHAALGLDAGAAAHSRAESRLAGMLEAGLLEEVRSLGGRLGPVAGQAVGYKELMPVVSGAVSLDDGVQAANIATRALIKRQRTFFGRDPRIAWLPWQDDPDKRISAALEAIERATQWTS
jgi:tRNA dimethylallyltransferase